MSDPVVRVTDSVLWAVGLLRRDNLPPLSVGESMQVECRGGAIVLSFPGRPAAPVAACFDNSVTAPCACLVFDAVTFLVALILAGDEDAE